MTYKDAWCATFVSAIAILLDYTDIIPTECSCNVQIALFKKLGRWQEDGTIVPEVADIIYYNWDKNMQPNDGEADHVGYVAKVNGKQITVIEGNYCDSVKMCTLMVGAGTIRGYAKPDYIKKASKTENPAAANKEQSYLIKAGDTLFTIAKEYQITWQKLASYNGIANPNKIQVGQVLKIPKNGTRTYTVKKEDNLWKIAKEELGNGTRFIEIKTMNRLKSTKIQAGQVLKLPEA